LRISTQRLIELTASTGFRAEIVEKVAQLLAILNELGEHQYLRERLVLKGGTALNLFVFDLPRLSVDIDLNYIGSSDRETMLAERPNVEKAITAVCGRLEFNVQRMPSEHAGGKWRLRYQTSVTQGANLELDMNFMVGSAARLQTSGRIRGDGLLRSGLTRISRRKTGCAAFPTRRARPF
jgi:predicted nucleotidyltransferase component of viral defense system